MGGVRFTPTRVGTTALSGALTAISTVHPHARGDDVVAATTSQATGGSPPRAWGRRLRTSVLRRRLGFTPTRVGTTPRAPGRWRSPAVHPHARGDDCDAYVLLLTKLGSPPR